ncbi:hypothetical protein [Frankia tisae]|nr:hypothetical protein [Frankia tisae]
MASTRAHGRRLTLTSDEVYDLVVDVASGALDNVEEIAKILADKIQGR